MDTLHYTHIRSLSAAEKRTFYKNTNFNQRMKVPIFEEFFYRFMKLSFIMTRLGTVTRLVFKATIKLDIQHTWFDFRQYSIFLCHRLLIYSKSRIKYLLKPFNKTI